MINKLSTLQRSDSDAVWSAVAMATWCFLPTSTAKVVRMDAKALGTSADENSSKWLLAKTSLVTEQS